MRLQICRNPGSGQFARLRTPEESMFSLAFVSRAAHDLPACEVDAIVQHAHKKNAERGITGQLCLRIGKLLQYVEDC